METRSAELGARSTKVKAEDGPRRRSVTWLLAATPWLVLLVMGTIIVHVLIVFGSEAKITHMTEFSRGLNVHGTIFGLSALAAIVSFPTWVVTACSKRFRLKTSEHFFQFLTYVAGCSVINFSPVLDPSGVANRLINW